MVGEPVEIDTGFWAFPGAAHGILNAVAMPFAADVGITERHFNSELYNALEFALL